MPDRLADDLAVAVLVEAIQHHAIEPGQSANLTGGFPENRRGRAVTLDPSDDRPYGGGRRTFLARGLLEFQHDLVPGAMHRDREQRAARLELPVEQGFNDGRCSGLLQATADVVQDIRGQAGGDRPPDDLVVRDAQIGADVHRCPRCDPVSVYR
ncbi:MAG TPA: hypothetical protein VNW90_32210 [Acetobacteraceae bacterium]|nr:hypothetical protein [Acetobacteraceae bacterium]